MNIALSYKQANFRFLLGVCILLFFFSCGVSKSVSEKPKILMDALSPSDSHLYKGLNLMFNDELKEAEAEFKKFVKLNPQQAVGYFYLAGVKLNQKGGIIDFNQVEKYSKKAFELNPDNKWYRMMYADALAYNEKYEEGAGLYEEMILNKDYHEEYFSKLLLFYQLAENYEKMLKYIDIADQYTSMDDDDIDALKLRVYHQIGDKEQIEKVLIRIAERDPKNIEKKMALAAFYKSENKANQANEIYQEIVKQSKDPEYRSAYYYVLIQSEDTIQFKKELRKAYIDEQDTAEIGRINEALYSSLDVYDYLKNFLIVSLSEITESDSAHHFAAEFLSGYYAAMGKTDSMGKYAMRAFELGSKEIGTYTEVISYFLNNEDFKGLIDFGNKTVIERDSFSIAYYGNALAYTFMEQDDSAIYFIDKALKIAGAIYLDSYKSDLYSLKGDAYHRQKKHKLSDESYDSALVYNPRNATALNNYAYYLSVRNERLQTALEMSEKSLTIESEQPSFLDTYGWIQYQLGNYEEAQKYVRKAIEYSPSPSMDLWDHLGDIEWELGNYSKAKDYWKLAIEAGDGQEEAIREKINQQVQEDEE